MRFRSSLQSHTCGHDVKICIQSINELFDYSGLYSDPVQTREQTILWQTPDKSDATPLETTPEGDYFYFPTLPTDNSPNRGRLNYLTSPRTIK